MNETQRNIRRYQAALPHLKEKVMAALLMLIISAVTATSASFAWIALSTAPEVSGLETTVAANGNLEIALSDTDGLEPEVSEIGDGGKDIVAKNVTWGNLVNLSDIRYGLDKLTLRPAQLNTTGSLTTQPLKVATYGYDGRVNTFSPDLLYTNYDATANDNRGAFVVAKDANGELATLYGVRAISTVKTGENTQGATVHNQIVKEADNSWANTRSKYFNIHHGEYGAKTKATLVNLLNAYVSYTLDGVDGDVTELIPEFYSMMQRFDDFIDSIGDTLCLISLAQQYPTLAENSEYYTPDTLCRAIENGTLNPLVNIGGLNQYAADRSQIKKIVAQLKNFNETGATVKWTQIHYIVDFMVDTDSVMIGGYTVDELKKLVDNATSNISTLLGLLDTNTEIHKGVLCNVENMILMDKDPQATDFRYTASEKISLHINNVPVLGSATVSTTVDIVAQKPYHIQTAYKDISSGDKTFIGNDAVAQDTYGLAIDFWLRTNATDAYVILEGNPVITQVEQTVEGSDEPVLVDAVTGYEGENRVWSESVMSNSTTQGTGSCYIFYPDTPEMQTRGLEILASMKIAFIDESGEILANADLDTIHAWEETGKVTVPVVLNSRSEPVVDKDGQHMKDENGEFMYAVAKMEPNISKRITAIVYMDGDALGNENALTDSGFQGQLNIQFGIDKEMNPMSDENLEYEVVNLSASASKTEFDFDTDTDLTSVISVLIDGVEPSAVTANFTRKINSSQGSREDTMIFTKVEDGKWETTATFAAPGEYILRSIFIDGVEYQLSNPITVTVSGFGIKTLSCDKILSGNVAEFMTADRFIDVSYSITIGSVEKLPSKIQGVVVDEAGNYIMVNLSSDTNSFTGSARFTRSGTYIFKYYIIGTDWYTVPENMQKVLKLNLGMTARVALSESEFILKDDPETEVNEARPTITVSVHILNDNGDIMRLPEAEGQAIELKYKHRTNSAVMLDTDLEWNETRNRYEGMINIARAGFYDFYEVSAGNSKIQKATSAPSIIARSPAEPKYTGFTVDSYQFAPNSTEAKVSVSISDSSTLNEAAIVDGKQTGDVKAVIKYLGENNTSSDRLYGTEYTVYGKMGSSYTNAAGVDITEWVFTVPAIDSDNNTNTPVSQHGWWELETSEMTFTAYDAMGNETQKTVTYVIDDVKRTDQQNVTQVSVDIKKNIKVSVSDFTGSADNKFNGNQMMVPYYIEDLETVITDTQGNAISGITNVRIFTRYTAADDVFILDGDITSVPHSGFGGAAVPTAAALAVADDPSTEDVNESLMKFRINTAENTAYTPLEVLYAGTYSVAGVQFTVNGIQYTGYYSFFKSEDSLGDNEFIIEGTPVTHDVNWTKPSVTVEATSPEEGTDFQVNVTGCNDDPVYNKNTISADGKSATVYYRYSKSGYLADGVPSKASFRMTGAGNYSSAVVSAASMSNTATISSVSGTSSLVNMGAQANLTSVKTGTYKFVNVKIYDASGISYTVTLADSEGATVTVAKG